MFSVFLSSNRNTSGSLGEREVKSSSREPIILTNFVNPERVNCYKHSFFIRIIRIWNDLPGDLVEAEPPAF